MIPHTSANPRDGRRRLFDSLATKIILLAFLSTFAMAAVVSGISIQSTHAYLSSIIDQQYPAVLYRARSAVETWLGASAAELERFARADAPRNGDRLARALDNSDHFEGLLLLSPAGEIEARAGRSESASLASVQRNGASDPISLHRVPFDDGDASVLAFALGTPHAPAGTLIGVLRGATVESLLADLQTGLGESILLVESTGQVVHGQKGPDRWIPMALLHEAATAAVRDYTNSSGVHVIHTAMALGLSGWHIAVEAPYDIVFEPVASAIKRIFAIDLCIVILFSLIAYKTTSAIVKPIQTLSEGATRIAQGQLDHEIPEPATRDEIGVLTRTFNEMMHQLRANQAQIECANEQLLGRNIKLEQANEILEQLSITDGLTKLHNHRFFQDHLTREIKRVNRVNEPLSMILVDIDDFKGLNDRFGHASGDELLRRLARLLNESVRETDLVARYGGEEFVVLAPDTDLDGARLIAEKIRTTVAESSFILDDSLRPVRTTVSIGVAQFLGNRKHFFAAADRALYQAKAEGKNCVVLDEDSLDT